MTKEIYKKLDTFQKKCLRHIGRLFWPEKIRNEDLLKSCNLEPISVCVKVKMVAHDHVLRMPNNSLARLALRWIPHGKCERGVPKITWRRQGPRRRGAGGTRAPPPKKKNTCKIIKN